jgi:hypothetical protein
MSGENGNGRRRHVLFAWSPTGYSLLEREGDPPAVGDEIDLNGRTLVINRVGTSPLPGDTRTCAYAIGKG